MPCVFQFDQVEIASYFKGLNSAFKYFIDFFVFISSDYLSPMVSVFYHVQIIKIA